MKKTVAITFNRTCEAAVLLASIVEPIEASTAVKVVPILSPNKMGMEASKLIIDSACNPCNIPMVALEL